MNLKNFIFVANFDNLFHCHYKHINQYIHSVFAQLEILFSPRNVVNGSKHLDSTFVGAHVDGLIL